MPRLVVPLAAAFLAALPLTTRGQADNFDDGNDAGWTHGDSLGGLGAGPRAEFIVTNGAYRIHALTSPNPGAAGPARAASFRQEAIYGRFYVAVDFVSWDTNLDQAFGILARVQPGIGLGMTSGYALTYQVDDEDIQISRVDGETPSAASPAVSVQLYATNRYRMVFIGNGQNLEGRIYLANDLATPLVTVVGSDSTYTSGTAGLVVYDNSPTGDATADAIFDNYQAQEFEPPVLLIEPPVFDEIMVSWPVDSGPFTLQSRGAFAPGSPWTNVPSFLIFTNGNRVRYGEVSTNGNKCFRLFLD